MSLENKIAVITGAGSGIGEAAARLFAKKGARVAAISHTEDEVRKVAQSISAAGGQAFALVADVAQPDEIEKAYRQITDRWDRIDIVFANAGINGVWAPVEELSLEEWNKTISTNLTGTFLTIKHAVPWLKRQGGSILVTASVNGTRIFSNTGATAYSVSKAGQVALTKMLALELAQFNIRVNVICPGSVDTEIDDNTEKRNLEKVKIESHFDRPIPLTNHPARAEQVAELAVFLASDAASHITGTPVWIDGAQSLLKG